MRQAPQALFNTSDALTVDAELLENLKRRALQSPTRRYRLCLHFTPEDVVQEMLVVHCRGNYSRPHCHPPGTASTSVVLEGAMTVYIFDDRGEVERIIDLEPLGGQHPFTLRIAGGIWHMPVCRTETAAWFEVMAGPFESERVNRWAPWSPDETDSEAVQTFLAPFLKATAGR